MDKKKILIVDDEESFTDMLKVRLEHTGNYDVIALSEAKDIVRHLHDFKPDVILLDLLLPGAGGLDVCEMLNADPIGISTPIIVVSGLTKDADKMKAYKLGISDYLVKPIDSKELISAIEKAIIEKSQAD